VEQVFYDAVATQPFHADAQAKAGAASHQSINTALADRSIGATKTQTEVLSKQNTKNADGPSTSIQRQQTHFFFFFFSSLSRLSPEASFRRSFSIL